MTDIRTTEELKTPASRLAYVRQWRQAKMQDPAWRDHLNQGRRARYAVTVAAVQRSNQKWHEANLDKAAAYKRAWAVANREKVRQANAAWRAANPEQMRSIRQAWDADNPDKVRAKKHRRRALERGAFVEDVALSVVVERDNGICGICHTPVEVPDYSLDHIMPLIKGGKHSYANVQLAHRRCNSAKGAQVPVDVDITLFEVPAPEE